MRHPYHDAEALAAAARSGDSLPQDLSGPLRVLWLVAAGDWHAAHEIAQDMPDPEGARLHAYLHRLEGDEANAGYWYRRAGTAPCSGPLAEEWRELVTRWLTDS